MGLGSGIRKKPIPDPGVKKAPDPGSGSATLVLRRVADPRHFNADPHPAFHFNADPDPAFHLNADPDPAPLQSDENLRPPIYRPSRALFCALRPPL